LFYRYSEERFGSEKSTSQEVLHLYNKKLVEVQDLTETQKLQLDNKNNIIESLLNENNNLKLQLEEKEVALLTLDDKLKQKYEERISYLTEQNTIYSDELRKLTDFSHEKSNIEQQNREMKQKLEKQETVHFLKIKELKEENDKKYEHFQTQIMKQLEEKKQELKRQADEQMDVVSYCAQKLKLET